jgi:hypothetical protein
MNPAPENAADELRRVWQILLREYPSAWGPLTVADQASALISLLLNLCVSELQRTDDDRLRAEMQRLAERLQTLAATDATQIDAMAQFLCDEPHRQLSRH